MPTFNNLHSRESVKAGNIPSYFCVASFDTREWKLDQFSDNRQRLGSCLLLHSACLHRSDTMLPWRSNPWHCIWEECSPLHRSQPEITDRHCSADRLHKGIQAMSKIIKRLLVRIITPVQRYRLLSGTAPTVLHKWLLSEDTCLLN